MVRLTATVGEWKSLCNFPECRSSTNCLSLPGTLQEGRTSRDIIIVWYMVELVLSIMWSHVTSCDSHVISCESCDYHVIIMWHHVTSCDLMCHSLNVLKVWEEVHVTETVDSNQRKILRRNESTFIIHLPLFATDSMAHMLFHNCYSPMVLVKCSSALQ